MTPILQGENTRLFGVACVVTCHRVPSDGPPGASGRTRVPGESRRETYERSRRPLLALYIQDVYTSKMADTAKIFQSGGSQAVRLPKAYRFEGQDEIEIRREGDRVILEPRKKSWPRDFLALAGSLPDFKVPPDLDPTDVAPDLD